MWVRTNEYAVRDGLTHKIEPQSPLLELEPAHAHLGWALEHYKHIKNPGLVAFMQNNFGQVIRE